MWAVLMHDVCAQVYTALQIAALTKPYRSAKACIKAGLLQSVMFMNIQ